MKNDQLARLNATLGEMSAGETIQQFLQRTSKPQKRKYHTTGLKYMRVMRHQDNSRIPMMY